MKIDLFLYYFFFVWYFCGLVLLAFDILPSYLEWANVVFLILVGVLGAVYFIEKYGARKGLVLSLVIIFLSIFAEHLGVKYGILFGDYYYTKDFGPKIADVPIAIGFAWLMVTAGSHAISKALYLRKHPIAYVLTASLLAVLMDCIIDPVAFKIKEYWVWQHNGFYYDIPFSNFAGWFLVSLVLHSILYITVSKKFFLPSIWESRMVLIFFLVLAMFVLLAAINNMWLAACVTVIPSLVVLIFYARAKKRIKP